MSGYAFIFSNKLRSRTARHFLFWALFTAHFFIQNLIVGTTNEALHPRTPLQAITNTAYFIPVYILSVYAFIYVVIPRFLFNHRYAAFAAATAALLIFNFAACYYAGLLYEHIEWRIPYDQITFSANKYHAVVNGGFVNAMILGIAGGIRFGKRWWQKKRESEAVLNQKLVTELQLLKTQINPRFLFHSLNAVKQNILAGSARAPQLILQVADLLSYILYESDQDYILLPKELAIIEGYLALEENSDKVSGRIPMVVSGKVDDKEIVPLILLSVVETAFECLLESTAKISVEVNMHVAAEQLSFSLGATGDFTMPEEAESKFSGIKKQLGGLYSDGYELRIEATQNQTVIYLQLPLRIGNSFANEQLTPSIVYEME